MLMQLDGKMAKSRATSNSIITVEEFKAFVDINYSDTHQYTIFIEVIEEFENEDMQLLLKFMSGRTRFEKGGHYVVNIGESYDNEEFPTSATCSNEMYIPYMRDKETM